MFLTLSCPVLLSLWALRCAQTLLGRRAEREAGQPHIDLLCLSDCLLKPGGFHPEPPTIERLRGTVQNIFKLQFMAAGGGAQQTTVVGLWVDV